MSYGQAAVPYLIASMGNPKPDARRRALQLLTELKAPEAFDTAVKALSDPDHTVQECAIYRLSLIGDKRAFEPLLEIMHSDDFDLPANAARAIGQLLGAEAVEYLLPMLQHRAAKTRETAVFALLKDVSDPRIPPAVAELLHDKNHDVRVSAMRFFKTHPYHVAKSTLLDLLGDPDPAIRSMAVTTLRSYDVRDLEISTIFRAMLLTEPKPNVRIAIVYSLCSSFTEADIPLLESLFDRHCKDLGGFFRNDYNTKMLFSILRLIRGEIEKLPFSPPEEAMPIVEFA
jgi:HEAT repeat protein